MTTLGVIVRPQLPPERVRGLVQLAEGVGLDEVWLWEDCFLEGGISSAAAALAWTERIRVGVGLLPVPLRNVAIAAIKIASVERMFPGRARFGVGHGVQEWMGQVGARVESPVTLLREYVDALRALLRGERVSVQGRYVRLDDVQLGWPPQRGVEILVGAVGPRTVRLSGEVADGTILSEVTPADGVRDAVRLVQEGREAAGRSGEHAVVSYLLAATGENGYARLRGEIEGKGLGHVAGLGVAGDAEAVAEGVRRLADAGADTVVLEPTGDEPDPEGFVRFVAQEVRPLVG